MLVTRCSNAGIDGPPAAASGIGNEDIHPAPFRDDALHHCFDRLVIANIDLDPQRGAAGRLDFGDRALGGHVFGLGFELFVGLQIEVGDRDLRPQSGKPLGVSAAEPSRRAGDERDFTVEFAHCAHLPLNTGRRFSTKALLASKWSSVIAVRA